MKTTHIITIGLLATGMLCTSCKSVKKVPRVPRQTAAVAVLEAPKSLEGAWIKLKSHGKLFGTHTDWWYVKGGKPHHYSSQEDWGEGHPVTPTSLGAPRFESPRLPIREDNLGQAYLLGELSYLPQGKVAAIKIVNYDRHDTTLCRSATIENGYPSGLSDAPAIITFTSADAGVYHGTVDGVWAAVCMGVQEIDSITIYTK